jgi:predicted enzyme related to lactoylglutathione lyase
MAAKKPARRKAPPKKSRTKSNTKKVAAKKIPKRLASPEHPPGPGVVHWEIQAQDSAKQQQFFAELFGWKVDANNPMRYGMVAALGEKSIAGGIGPTTDAPRVTIYVQVPDINAALAKAASLGAQTVVPRSVMGPVTMALFRDLEGNVIGLVEG